MKGDNIKLFCPERHYISHKKEYDDIFGKVLSGNRHVLGKYTEELESQIAKRTNRKYAVAVITGSSALYIAFRAIRALNSMINPKVLSTNYTFAATPEAALQNNCSLYVNDIDRYAHMELECSSEEIDILYPVNLFGNCMNYDKVEEFCKRNYIKYVIEDAAQSFGAYWNSRPSGSLGNISCLSFDNKKNLASFDQGGMLLTDDEDICIMLRKMRQHGETTLNKRNGNGGINGVMPELTSANLLYRLENFFDDEQNRRRDIAKRYIEGLASTPLILPEIDHKVIPVWQKFVIRTDNKHEFIDFLRCSGIESQPVYDYIISNCNFIEKDKVICRGEENSTKWSTSAVLLPMNPELTDDEIERVISVIHEYFK